MSIEQICIFLIALLASALALDYMFTLQEEGATACPGDEDIFLGAYFDLSKIVWKQIDEETIMLQGYITFLKEVDPNLHLHIDFQKFSSGRWVETAFQIDRPNVCETLFDENEIWYDFVKEMEANSKLCPPNSGTKYDFKDKKVSIVLRDLTPGMEGTYRAVLKVFDTKKNIFCMTVEGELAKKLGLVG